MAKRGRRRLAESTTLRDWVRAFRHILGLVPRRQSAAVISGLLLAGILELLGIGMIIPMLASAAHLRESKGGIVTAMRTLVESVGLPFTPESILIIVFVGLTLKAVVSIIVMRYVSNLVAGLTENFQLELIRSLLRAKWSFFIRQPLGRLVHATGPEAVAVGECFQNVTSVLATFIQSVLFIGLAALISWPLALLAIGIGVLIFLSFGRMVRHGRMEARRHREQMRSHAAKFTDAMIGIKPIRAMGRTEQISRLFEEDAIAISSSLRARVLSGEYAGELQEPVIGCILAGGFFVAIHALTLPLNDVVIMALLLVRAISALAPIQRQLQRLIQAYDQYCSLKELMDVTKQAAEATTGTVRPSLERAISFDAITFGYGSPNVLEDFSLQIPRGRITCLAGPSGVGKSTTVDLLVGLHAPLAGRILIDDVDLQDVDLEAWRARIGYVPQEVVLFHDTIFRNVGLWEENITEEAVEEALRAAGALSFVSAMPEGIGTIVGERGHRLSGGQRQRISIARALLHRPALLILDEATTGLDPSTEQEICAHIHDLTRSEGLTVLAVSHQPAWQQVADIVYALRDGRANRVHDEALIATG